jgi:hypothetical protein
MKKSHRHNELSGRICAVVGCIKHIKQRLVETKDAILCYGCFCKNEANRAHYVNANPRRKRIEKGLPVKSFR